MFSFTTVTNSIHKFGEGFVSFSAKVTFECVIFWLYIFSGFSTEVAMKKAMYNVEKNYAVVGVLEDMNKTLTVLEHYVPRSVIIYPAL